MLERDFKRGVVDTGKGPVCVVRLNEKRCAVCQSANEKRCAVCQSAGKSFCVNNG